MYKHRLHKVSGIPREVAIGLLRVFPCVCSLSCIPHDRACTPIVCHVDVSCGQGSPETSRLVILLCEIEFQPHYEPV